jgi:PAS domain S-box-containing protein
MVVARSRAEESLHESEERYRKLVELSPDAIYVQQEGKIAFINAAGAKLFGASGPSEVQGWPVSDLTHENNHRMIRKLFVQAEEEEMAFSLLKIKYRRLDGTVVDAEAAIAPMQFQGARAALVIARDMSERKGMEEKIRLYQQELYSVASEMSSLSRGSRNVERNLIAADLHEYVGQNLVVLQFKLGALRKLLSAPELIRHLEEIRELIGQTIAYTRSLTVELSPPVLVEIGLTAALESLAEGFRKNHGILVSVEDDGHLKETDDDTRYLLFRSVRELLMNVVKHARASNVGISLKIRDRVRITVADNGIGFDAVTAIRTSEGFGLFTIRERMKRLGGSCEIETEPGSGTKVTLLAPLRL